MFKGLYAVLVTPFQADGTLDEASLDRLVDFYLEKQVHGLVTLSVMGEGHLLSEAEKMLVAFRVISRVGDRIPVVVGINEKNAAIASNFAQKMVNLGASALLVVPPSMPSPGADLLLEYYQAIAATSNLPLAVLDYPPITGKLPVSFLKKLADEIAQVRAVKLEDTPTTSKIKQLRTTVGNRLQILGALGGSYCLPELIAGSDGLMTGYAYPEHLLTIFNQFQLGHLSEAEQTYQRCLPMLQYEQKYGLAWRKEILRQRGAIATARLRTSGTTILDQIPA
jgi:4-hydroxy-tetrahydrodipicolinate synthase